MKSKIVNLEHSISMRLNDLDKFRKEDLNKITEAWSLGDYRIWFEVYFDLLGNPLIEISAKRGLRHEGVDITRRWIEVRRHLELGDIPEWLVKAALKH